MHLDSVICSAIFAAILLGCTSNDEAKTCMCEVVTPQPSCEAAPVAAIPTPSSESATPATGSSAPASVPAAEVAAVDANDRIEEMNAPKTDTQAQASSANVSQMPEDPIIEERDIDDPNEIGKSLLVATDGLNIRSGPSMQSAIIGSLRQGVAVKMLSREGIWVMIGENQYVSIRYLKDQ